MARLRFLALSAMISIAATVVTVFATAVPVSGIVVDSKGAPVSRAVVIMFKRFTTVSSEGLSTIGQATTDERGRFSFGPIDPDADQGLSKNMPDQLFTNKGGVQLSYTVQTGPSTAPVFRTVESVSPSVNHGKDNSVQSVSLRIVVR